MKRILPLLVVLALGAGAYVYFNRPVTALVLTGLVTTNDIVVGPQIGGRIDDLRVQEGDTVKQGQVLAVISPDELRAESAYAVHNVEGIASQIEQSQSALRFEQQQMNEQVRQAESNLAATEAQQAAAVAELEAARINLDRTQRLANEGVAPAQQLDTARTSHDAAVARVDALKRQADAHRAAIALAKTNVDQVAVKRGQVLTNQHLQEAAAAQQAKADVRLGYTEVKAPADGIVDVRAARPGEIVTAGQAVVTLIDPDDLWVRADVEETYIDRVRIGDRMQVRLPSGAALECPVFYRGLDAGFATQRDVSRTKRDIKIFEIRLRCDNADRRLAVGMTAYVDLPLR
ncbi:MAG TPA: efflux RND transporter periplasmic adaptor subunit [Vicinamibacterales bacterium]|nr:efflux RND transporter periplasmic adaptor subunit [Vicinamibacterales bacterium]